MWLVYRGKHNWNKNEKTPAYSAFYCWNIYSFTMFQSVWASSGIHWSHQINYPIRGLMSSTNEQYTLSKHTDIQESKVRKHHTKDQKGNEKWQNTNESNLTMSNHHSNIYITPNMYYIKGRVKLCVQWIVEMQSLEKQAWAQMVVSLDHSRWESEKLHPTLPPLSLTSCFNWAAHWLMDQTAVFTGQLPAMNVSKSRMIAAKLKKWRLNRTNKTNC